MKKKPQCQHRYRAKAGGKRLHWLCDLRGGFMLKHWRCTPATCDLNDGKAGK